MDDLLTTEELARKWKIRPKTLDNWRSARIGPPFVKIMGSIRYPESQADEWVASQQRDAEPRQAV